MYSINIYFMFCVSLSNYAGKVVTQEGWGFYEKDMHSSFVLISETQRRIMFLVSYAIVYRVFHRSYNVIAQVNVAGLFLC